MWQQALKSNATLKGGPSWVFLGLSCAQLADWVDLIILDAPNLNYQSLAFSHRNMRLISNDAHLILPNCNFSVSSQRFFFRCCLHLDLFLKAFHSTWMLLRQPHHPIQLWSLGCIHLSVFYRLPYLVRPSFIFSVLTLEPRCTWKYYSLAFFVKLVWCSFYSDLFSDHWFLLELTEKVVIFHSWSFLSDTSVPLPAVDSDEQVCFVVTLWSFLTICPPWNKNYTHYFHEVLTAQIGL